jgi:hypothetical protein
LTQICFLLLLLLLFLSNSFMQGKIKGYE